MNDMKFYNNRTIGGGSLARISDKGVASRFNKRTHTWVVDEDVAFEIEFTGDWERISEAAAFAVAGTLVATA